MAKKPAVFGILALGIAAITYAGTSLFDKHADGSQQLLEEKNALQEKVDAIILEDASTQIKNTGLAPQNNLSAATPVSFAKLDAAKPPAPYQIQFNPTFLAEWTYENPFIDYMKVKGYPNEWRWIFTLKGKALNTKQAEQAGFIDPVTGDPKSFPPNLVELQGPLMVFGYTQFPEWYSGDWVFTWDGVADVTIWDKKVKVKSSKTIGRGGRMVFTMPRSGASLQRARFTNIRTPITNLRLMRAEHEELANEGQIWNPDFLNYAKNYDVIRTMVWQDINGNPSRRFADIAKPDDPHFVNRPVVTDPTLRPANDRYGISYEHLFNLASVSKTDLWMHIPLQIGAKLHQSDALGNVDAVFQSARQNGRAIVESPEWDIFANELAARIIASDYPKDRALYIELGNEIWNYAYPFVLGTRYADGIAKSFNQDQSARFGYGILSAKMIMSMEAALQGSGYKPTYVIASQTASPYTTKLAYDGLTAYARQKNISPSSLISKTGVALTTYHGGADAYRALVTPRSGESLVQAYEREITLNGPALKTRLHDYYVNSGKDVVLTKAWLVDVWKMHRNIARQYGARLIGAYEGGSHDNPPPELAKSETFINWWTQYHWGPEGSDVVRQINKAIIDEFPGVMLSNFTGNGVIGDYRSPWYDGHYSKPTDMSRMWAEFEK